MCPPIFDGLFSGGVLIGRKGLDDMTRGVDVIQGSGRFLFVDFFQVEWAIYWRRQPVSASSIFCMRVFLLSIAYQPGDRRRSIAQFVFNISFFNAPSIPAALIGR